MAKLVLSRDGKVVNHYFLDKPVFSIGRDTGNDIALADEQLDARLLSIARVGNDAIVEKLLSAGSANINGKPFTRHILQHLDIIDLGRYQLRYMSAGTAADAELDRTMLIRTVRAATADAAPLATELVPFKVEAAKVETVKLREGKVEFISGPAAWTAGSIVPLERVVTTFGEPGDRLIVLTRRPHGIFLSHVEGRKLPRINGETIGNAAHALKPGDIIEGAGCKLRFVA
ncbi:MAG: FHA domain-containing protein [Rhodocyclaceae bacterium]|nr:FHA domain-containing protein [Rhodocyclaceae bacterium]